MSRSAAQIFHLCRGRIRQSITRAIADQGRTIRIPVRLVESINRVKKTTGDGKMAGSLPRKRSLFSWTWSRTVRAPNCDWRRTPSAWKRRWARKRMPAAKILFRTRMQASRWMKPGGGAAGTTFSVLKSLTPREERVIALRFGLEDGRAHTLEELGKEFQCDPGAGAADRSQGPAQGAASQPCKTPAGLSG